MGKITGLPEELGVEEALEREEERIRVRLERRRFGKPTTIVEGIRINVRQTLKILKSKLACGGTFKTNHIELQGDHRQKVKQILIQQGYDAEQIEVI